MPYNEQEFRRLIRKANSFFTEHKSSLAPIIRAIQIDPNAHQIVNMRILIKRMPLAKRMKYREALCYLECEYAKKWLGLPSPPTPPGLREEPKIRWEESTLTNKTLLIHCTSVGPEKVIPSGLDPKYSTEWCVPNTTDEKQFKWNRFVFFFALGTRIPPKASAQFGFGSYIYVVDMPASTTYMTQDGNIAINSEIGFPQPIKAKHIVGIFRYQTGDQDPDAKKKGLDKTDYILEELDPAAPGTVRKKHVGSNKEVSATKAGTVVKNLFSQ
jgi:hypothetical protein